MKYLSKKKTLFLLVIASAFTAGIYFLPVYFESLLLQKIIWTVYIVAGTALGLAFFLVNGASTAIVDGEYEKNFYKALKEGKAENEGENLHWNPLKLSLAKRIYYSKILICFLFPIIAMLFIDYIWLLIEMLN